MKKLFKIIGIILGSLIVLVIVLAAGVILYFKNSTGKAFKENQKMIGDEVKTMTIEGFTFRDLNKNGKLDIYEDSRQTTDARVNDLISQMTLEEKAGTMFFGMIGMNRDGSLAEKFSLKELSAFYGWGTTEMMFGKNLNHFNIFVGSGKKQMAIWYNNIQKLAERSRLGIPVTIASDPRNHYFTNALMSAFAGDMTTFPQPLGLAAMRDSALVAEFANIARQEYLDLGIRVALHPQIDLATEPRWGRVSGTFGEDAYLTAMLTTAYIKGFQGDTLGVNSVACMTKHFPGGGPQKEGIDPHLPIQKGQVYPGNNFDYHLIPFEAAFKAGTASIMPYYGVPMNRNTEEVGFSFNHDMITGLLRGKYAFEGVVCTDWGLVSDIKLFGKVIAPARAWGMEKASEEERVLKIINAGVDQLGGEVCSEIIVKLVNDGKIPVARIDQSVKRLLNQKFVLGLFDNPFIDVEKAVKEVGNEKYKSVARLAHRKSLVLLKNDTTNKSPILPLKSGLKIFVQNIDPIAAAKYGTVVDKPELADFAIIRISSPDEEYQNAGLLGKLIKGGDLDFKEEQKKEILDLISKVPAIVDITINRAAVIPEITAASKGLIASFGSPDDALLDIVFGKFNPQGKLPLELPSSMDAVRKQKEDVPYDSENPLFPFGFGLSYN